MPNLKREPKKRKNAVPLKNGDKKPVLKTTRNMRSNDLQNTPPKIVRNAKFDIVAQFLTVPPPLNTLRNAKN